MEKSKYLAKCILISSLLSFYCEKSNPVEEISAWDGKRITDSSYAIVNGIIIDGTGSEPLDRGAIVVRGERIVAVGLYGKTDIPPDAQVVNVYGAAILPGFINAHVHKSYDETKLRTWAWNGVTTVRDEGILSSQTIDQALAIRDSARKKPECARLISAGYMMTVTNGYGGLYVTSPDDARQKVFVELDKGVDLIKISQEDGYAGRHDLPKLSDEEMSAIISAAHERGKFVSAHITQSLYWRIVVQAGVDDVAHAAYDYVTDEVLDLMVLRGIYLVPTFTIFRNYNAPVSVCIENVRRFVHKGGKVTLGNDFEGGTGSFDDGIPWYELNCMLEAGMTPMQIIVASTRNAAHVCNLDTLLGTLEAGKIADMLVVKGNPLNDFNDLANVMLVIHNGTNIRAVK
jgi:imidazolonepropionase-like amidohydrolase